jgi:3-oxoacyl-[acyl-carrier protein] reductase
VPACESFGFNPGPGATDRMVMLQCDRAAKELGDPNRWQELLAGMPFRRAATPEEIANAVAFLASPRPRYNPPIGGG